MPQLSEGQYHAFLRQVRVVQVGEKKTEAFETEWEVQYCWDGQSWVGGNNLPATRHIRYFLTDAAWPYTEEKLGALEFNGNFSAPKLMESLYTEGRALTCKYDDRGYEKWEVAGLVGVQADPADDNTLRRLNAKWKAKRGNGRGVAVPAPAPPAAQPAAQPASAPAMVGAPSSRPTMPQEPIPDDDIPF